MTERQISYMHLDVFAEKPLTGNGLVVFFGMGTTERMQGLTKEMRQFESIFLDHDGISSEVSARIFTLDEEIEFAGHPLLGAACALHMHSKSEKSEVTWTFNLKKRKVVVTSRKSGDKYFGTMDQGKPEFLNTLSEETALPYLQALNLSSEDLDRRAPVQVVSTGLPYLIIPVSRNFEVVKVVLDDLDPMLEKIEAKFTYVVNIESHEGRSWDNYGHFEDVATGSAAGPFGAYLIEHGFEKMNDEFLIHQGRFVGRPSTMKVLVNDDGISVSGFVIPVAKGRILTD